MDEDEFDDDIADEDFLEALDQAPSSNHERSLSQSAHLQQQQRRRPQSSKAVSGATVAVNLDDLPSDAFSSPEPQERRVFAIRAPGNSDGCGPRKSNGLHRTSSGSFRQTTLWGSQVPDGSAVTTQAAIQRVYRADLPREEPTHHEIDKEEMRTWVYPTNLGAIRDYQFSIVKNSLFNNTLVALPTGLGKTFIAATVMMNYYRWTKTAKIVFVAPTKPLVAQQVDACYNIAGIPRSDTTLLTGDIAPALRVDEWEQRRVFFMTPQTLLNDLSHGYADPKSIALMVIDEAHRAVGEYAYAKVTKLIRRFSKSFRVLALTATPGSKVETVQEVIDNLGISHCEIRTEDSIDIRQYVHQRNINQIVLDPSDEMNLITELFTAALKPLTDKLSSQNIYYGRNPMAMTNYGLMQAQKEWFASRGQHTHQGVQFMMRAIFSVLTSIAHSIKLLNFHGIKPFYDNMVDFRGEQESKGEKGSKYKRQIIEHAGFREMMDKISGWTKLDGFVGHPKQTALADCVLNHFMDQGEGSATRVIVFSEYRDSAEEIVRILNKHKPLIKASVFVGQADGKRGEGMKQAQQIRTIERFKNGEFNVLVATSIGEEGLDIGQVDLIVCYDASASPIRMLQRMGRTGRKRAGNIVLLLMRGKEEDQFARSKDNYEKMQKLICEGSKFNFRFDLSTRIVPKDIRPEVDKRHVDIPVENTQNRALPEPKKRRTPAGKKPPPKKFHMPDGVETGFRKLSDFMKSNAPKPPRRNPELDDTVGIPDLQSVVLSSDDLRELDRSYRDLPFNHNVVEETDMPNMSAHPVLQRCLRPVAALGHGTLTKRVVTMLGRMGTEPETLAKERGNANGGRFRDIPVKAFVNSDGESEASGEEESAPKKLPDRRRADAGDESDDTALPPRKKRKSTGMKQSRVHKLGESEAEDSETSSQPAKRKGKRKGAKHKKQHSRRGGINSDEIGDDCERSSDLLDSGGSDFDDDLLDFVVADNQTTSSMRDSQPTSPTTASPHATPKAPDKPQFYVPTHFSATQESEDIPELADLMGSQSRDEVPVSDVKEARRARARRHVMDFDSDDDL